VLVQLPIERIEFMPGRNPLLALNTFFFVVIATTTKSGRSIPAAAAKWRVAGPPQEH